MSTSQSDPGLPAAIDQQNKKFTTIIIYPTVTPEKIIIPMVSCILGFPLLALMVICCLRRRAKLARDRDRRRNLGFARACTSDQGVISLARFSPMHKIGVYLAAGTTANCGGRNHPLRSESRSYASCDLDPVMEERSEMDSSCTVAGIGGMAAESDVTAECGSGGGAVEALVCPDS
ncbi:uncharacterized protein LOC112687628 [Sipha flava]|uniref:Uncharacterized protein LOC112687628 n=1 Tax=Sipha flava TaxID=143950 RepID=A0A2S2R728_9HEMI|nr:uncharacterized protein LOC112687628 [Sipha flava]XP_025416232.1 uncharacterized protein LOC112687628 [Sipha flava]XP_025416233.1 uncharacterized protein LOC112687628 [Sipha flava]XP_025416234.1 uncharacterized protein LOC112687628 [Sipha flava]XP_025416235.1 uncharacterized protein LOC112687628 [Sipha flava]